MIKLWDYVIFTKDGARGLVMSVNDDRFHVMWEDYFVSWEQANVLKLDESMNRLMKSMKLNV